MISHGDSLEAKCNFEISSSDLPFRVITANSIQQPVCYTATLEVVTEPLKFNDVASFTPKTILFDESHCDNGSSLWAPGNASMFSWVLSENGYSSSTNFDENLDSGILNDYDILALFFPVYIWNHVSIGYCD